MSPMKRPFFGLMLAVAIAVAGCQSPVQTAGSLAPAKQQAAMQASQGTAQTMAEEREMEYYAYLVDEEGAARAYAVMADAASPSPSPSASTSASPSPSASPSTDASASPTPKPSATPRVVVTPKPRTVTPAPTRASAAPTEKPYFRGKLNPEFKAQIDARHARMKEKSKPRLDGMKPEREAIAKVMRTARWVKNTDGTESQAISFKVERSVNGQTTSRAVSMTRVRMADDKTLVSAKSSFEMAHDGMTRKVTRDKSLQEDGSYVVTFHSEITHKDGSKRVADWTKTIAADGSVSGTGAIVWTGKVVKTVSITFGGTEEAETAKAADAETKTESAVTMPAEGGATAQVKDETGASAAVTVQAEVDAVAPTTAAP
ncbi:hypothetical protein D3C72_1142270 [compost metagenome]